MVDVSGGDKVALGADTRPCGPSLLVMLDQARPAAARRRITIRGGAGRVALGTVCYGNSMGRGDSARLSKLVTRGEPGYSVVVIVDHLVSFTVSHHMVAPLRMEDIFELRGRSTGGSRFRRLISRQKKRPAPFVLRVLYASHGGSETSSTEPVLRARPPRDRHGQYRKAARDA